MSENETGSHKNRRNFLATTGAGVTVAALTTINGCSSSQQSGDSTRQYGMVIDLKKCVGCNTCTIACKAENHTPPGVSYIVVMEEEIGTYPNVKRRFVPRPCMQCQQPSCTQVCPTQATYLRNDGVIAIDYDKCIGCRYCIAACPYGARSFDFGHDYLTACAGGDDSTNSALVAKRDEDYSTVPSPEYGEKRLRAQGTSPQGNVRKCHFCLHRVKRGMLPACASACPGRAIYFGDLNDSESLVYRVKGNGQKDNATFPNFPGRNVMQLKPETGNDPSVYYLT